MKRIILLVSIIVISILVARTEPPSITASAHATDSKAVQEPRKAKTDTKPSETPKALVVAETKPQEPTPAPRQLTQPEQWMQAAGIVESDWQYVDCIISGCGVISPEGNWDGVQKWNSTGSGAYGLCQSLPADKMASAGADWRTNPVTQLKWCATHAANYGGWKQAWEFRQCVGSCYSAYAKYYVDKDHTWW